MPSAERNKLPGIQSGAETAAIWFMFETGTWQITYGYDDHGEVNVTWPAEPVEVQQTIVAESDDTPEPQEQFQELIADVT